MTRLALPQKRRQETVEVVSDDQVYSASFGFHRDGSIGEVFIQAHKAASQLEAAARDGAILMSFAIQHGAPLDAMRDAMTRDENGNAASVFGAVLDTTGAAARA